MYPIMKEIQRELRHNNIFVFLTSLLLKAPYNGAFILLSRPIYIYAK